MAMPPPGQNRRPSVGSAQAHGGRASATSAKPITVNTEKEDDPSTQDPLGQMLVKLKVQLNAFLGKKESTTAEEKKLDDNAMLVHTFRGVDNADESEEHVLWVDSACFDVTMSCIIILNTIVIGLEVDLSNPKERELIWYVLEGFFCICFIMEIVFKIYYHKCVWIILSIWNFITFVVALLAFVDAAILHPIGIYGNLRVVSLLRVAGLVRLVRLIRKYKPLEELRLVVQGLVESFQTLAWTVVLSAAFIYICAVLLTKQIGHNTEVYGDYRKLSGGWDHEEYFGTVGRSMYTLLQAMTLDSWLSKVARHTIANQWYMTGFWVIFLLISTFGIMNIVVSVIVELMLTASQNNEKRLKVVEDRARRQELEGLREIFMVSDVDSSGDLSFEEFMTAVKNPEVQWRMRQLDLPLGDAAKLFHVLDDDKSRKLTITEFINQCMKLKGPAQSKELLAIQAHAEKLARKMDILAQSLADSERMMGALDEVTSRISKRFDVAVLGSRRKIAHSVGGTSPMKPPPRQGPQGDEAPLSIGNRPVLPQFPDLLR